MKIEAGFLILKTYERLYRDYRNRYNLEKPFYAIPRIDQKPSDFRIQYRGLDRDALDPVDYEAVWTRIAHLGIAEPKGFKSIGYEPTYFTGDHFSASCDCMLIPRWH